MRRTQAAKLMLVALLFVATAYPARAEVCDDCGVAISCYAFPDCWLFEQNREQFDDDCDEIAETFECVQSEVDCWGGPGSGPCNWFYYSTVICDLNGLGGPGGDDAT